jgi:hypothetical protein
MSSKFFWQFSNNLCLKLNFVLNFHYKLNCADDDLRAMNCHQTTFDMGYFTLCAIILLKFNVVCTLKNRKIWDKLQFFKTKKCVAYPQEDFLFTILYGDSWRPPKNYIKYLKIEKTKIHMGSIPQSLQT